VLKTIKTQINIRKLLLTEIKKNFLALFGYLIHSYITYIVLRTLIIIVRVFLLLCSWNCKERYDYYYCYVHKFKTLKGSIYSYYLEKKKKLRSLHYTIVAILYTMYTTYSKKQTSIFVFWKQKFKKKYYFVRFIDTITIIITYIIIIRELREKRKIDNTIIFEERSLAIKIKLRVSSFVLVI